jgi:hypothetical protein
MTAARHLPTAPTASKPEPAESGVGLIAPPSHASFLDRDDLMPETSELPMADVVSLRPAAPPPLPPPRVAAEPAPKAEVAAVAFVDDAPTQDIAVPKAEFATLSLEASGDDELLALVAHKKRTKFRARLAGLAFPVAIAGVLFALSGEGHPKDMAAAIMGPAVSKGESIATKIARDANELEEIRAELALAEKLAQQDAANKTQTKKRRGLPKTRR